MKLIAPLRAASLQLFYRLMSHAEVECRHSLAWVVRDEWPLAMANDPNASVRFENMQGLLPRVRTALQRGPDRYLRLEMACGIAADESPDVFENEDKSMQDLACAGMAAALRVHEERCMNKIGCDSDVVELSGPPVFSFSEKVRANRTIRNDGTFRGKEIGEVLVKKGEVGYVVSIGTFLQQFYIYGVEFLERGYRVGMKRKELESVDAYEEIDDLPLPKEAVS